jgi:zinc transporter ZupT
MEGWHSGVIPSPALASSAKRHRANKVDSDMNSLVLPLALTAFLFTLLGGCIILRFRSKLHYIFAFAAGSLLGVAFLDILPESLRIASLAHLPVRYLMIAVVAAFFFFHLLERFFVTHHVEEHQHHGHIMGPIGAGSLVIHSWLDGVAIGAGFQVSPSIGLVISLAVILHDFTDGINVVTIMLKNNQRIKKTILFLILDAAAPVLGIITVSLVKLSESILAVLLAVFVGEFLYIGASNLLPATREFHSKMIVLAMAGGIALIVAITAFV